MRIKLMGKNVDIAAKKVSRFGKYLGLMFAPKSTQNLLFEFKPENKIKIHSFFVFFNFLAVWLDDENVVVDFDVVKPFTFLVKPKKPCRKLLEIPMNKANHHILKIFDVK